MANQITVPNFTASLTGLLTVAKNVLFDKKYPDANNRPNYGYLNNPWGIRVALLNLQNYKDYLQRNPNVQKALGWDETKDFMEIKTLRQVRDGHLDVGMWSFKWPRRQLGNYDFLNDADMCEAILAMNNTYLFLDPLSNKYTNPQANGIDAAHETDLAAMPLMPLFANVLVANEFNAAYYASIWCVYELLGGVLSGLEADRHSLEQSMYMAIEVMGRVVCAQDAIQRYEQDYGVDFRGAVNALNDLCYLRRDDKVITSPHRWGREIKALTDLPEDTLYVQFLDIERDLIERVKFLRDTFYLPEVEPQINMRFYVDYLGNGEESMDLSAITAAVIDLCYVALAETARNAGADEDKDAAEGSATLLMKLLRKVLSAELWTSNGNTGVTLRDYISTVH